MIVIASASLSWSRRSARLLPAFALGACLLAVGCDADVDITCAVGDCADYQPPVPETAQGQGGASSCYEGCDTLSASGKTGLYPCAVEKVMLNCRRCHSANPSIYAASFALDTYEESQALLFDVPIWALLETSVRDDRMPLQEDPLSAEEKAILLDDWACKCAPPRETMDPCQ